MNHFQPHFESEWYSNTYRDALLSGMEPWEHYSRIGSFLGRPSSSSDCAPKAHPSEASEYNPSNRQTTHVTSRKVLVTVIIPIYDRTDVLRSSILSALNQSISSIEIILITDGSPSNTLDVVREFSCEDRVKIFNFPLASGNAVRGRNKGILEANGQYIAFLDSDDLAAFNRIELCLPYLENGEADVVYGGWQAVLDGTREVQGIADGQAVSSPDADLEMLLQACVPCQSTVMLKKVFLEKYGFLKPSMQYREDHELWVRLAYNGARFKSVSKILTKLRLHNGNNELNFKAQDDHWFSKVLSEYKILGPRPKKIVFILPGVGISGGIAVVFKHAALLMSASHDVLIVNVGGPGDGSWFPDNPVPIVHISDTREYLFRNIDLLFATAWSTVEWLGRFESKRKLYFVQSDERRFSDDPAVKRKIHDTYLTPCEYLTEAFWIQKLLLEEFGHASTYVPNGLDTSRFRPDSPLKPKRFGRARVLLEGPICIPFKGMADCYAAVAGLDCEIWIVSSAGKPPEDWQYDEFFEGVPFSEMRKLYSSCDIFLKMSRIEGFFGPPMEAMACGCAVVVGKVSGYDEYIIHEKNALVVEQGDILGARDSVRRLIDNEPLRQQIIKGGFETVPNWSWEISAAAMLRLVEVC
jgi:glycosyltransferase involved in cell wall biosynthesis